MSEQKHAYLIIAHKDDASFRALLEMIDDSRNVIYVHMDAKCRDYNPHAIESTKQFSTIYHIGEKSHGEEVALSGREATSTYSYQYYHLLSGQDLPTKSQDYIHSFFEEQKSKEFVDFYSSDFRCQDRVGVYHLFQEYLGRRASIRLNRYFLKFQEITGNRRNKDVSFYKGA